MLTEEATKLLQIYLHNMTVLIEKHKPKGNEVSDEDMTITILAGAVALLIKILMAIDEEGKQTVRDFEAFDKKLDEVAEILTGHIKRGNDV
ncbi:MAG: hypothetical protein IKG44_00400 [Mogibacterium sp.]|nr:hypothetical protein [Mogibacterium sp.]